MLPWPASLRMSYRAPRTARRADSGSYEGVRGGSEVGASCFWLPEDAPGSVSRTVSLRSVPAPSGTGRPLRSEFVDEGIIRSIYDKTKTAGKFWLCEGMYSKSIWYFRVGQLVSPRGVVNWVPPAARRVLDVRSKAAGFRS